MVGPSKAEIWNVDFSGSRGHEQKGKRPCIIWRDLDHVGMAIVIPLTSNVERDSFPHTHLVESSSGNGLDSESVALIFQITAISKDRFIEKLGVLDAEDVHAIGAVMKDLLRV